MKLFAKLMIAALFIAMALPFTVLKNKDGSTLLSFSDLELPSFSLPELPSLPSLPSLSDGGKVLPSVEGLAGKDIVYQWRGADGGMQFSTDPVDRGAARRAGGGGRRGRRRHAGRRRRDRQPLLAGGDRQVVRGRQEHRKSPQRTNETTGIGT